MQHVKVVICGKDQTEPAFPEVTNENFLCVGKLEGASVLQTIMPNGKTGLGLLISTQEGKYIMVQTTLNMIEGIFAAGRGAEQCWKDEDASHN